MSNITLFTTPTCQPCKIVARKLSGAGLSFRVVDLTAEEAAADLRRLRGPEGRPVQTPLVEVDGIEVMRGMDPAALGKILADAKAAA